jgi:polysaccharide biosynthesis protein PslH
VEGGPIAVHMMIEGAISLGHNVKVLAVNSFKYNVEPGSVPQEYREKSGIEFIYVDLRIKPMAALINMIRSRSYHVQRFISAEFKKKLEQILQENQFDIIQFELLHMSPYIDSVRKYSKGKVILRAHNIEHLIWERIAKNTRNPLKKFYLTHLAKTLKRYENSAIRAYDGIVAITGHDAAFFKEVIMEHSGMEKKKLHASGLTPSKITPEDVITIPFGIDLSRFPDPPAVMEFPSLFSIGSMNWQPNIEGIGWFLEKVWPQVHEQFPVLKFYLAGRHMPEWIARKEYPNVVVVGEVADSLQFMHSKAIMVVPLLSGSGIRIKIIEGMAAGRAIISTSIGAEGIDCTDGKNILLADTTADFTAAIARLATEKNQCLQIGNNARSLVKEAYQQNELMRKLVAFYEKPGTQS